MCVESDRESPESLIQELLVCRRTLSRWIGRLEEPPILDLRLRKMGRRSDGRREGGGGCDFSKMGGGSSKMGGFFDLRGRSTKIGGVLRSSAPKNEDGGILQSSDSEGRGWGDLRSSGLEDRRILHHVRLSEPNIEDWLVMKKINGQCNCFQSGYSLIVKRLSC